MICSIHSFSFLFLCSVFEPASFFSLDSNKKKHSNDMKSDRLQNNLHTKDNHELLDDNAKGYYLISIFFVLQSDSLLKKENKKRKNC